MSIAMTDL